FDHRPSYRCSVELVSHAVESLTVGSLSNSGNVERRHADILFHDIIVDTDDRALVLVDLLLVSIGRLGNLALEEATADTCQHATQSIDTIQVIYGSPLRLVRQ